MCGDFDHFKYVVDVGQIDVDDVDLRDRRSMVHWATISGSDRPP